MLTNLIQEAVRLPQVSQETAEAYQEEIPVLEEWIHRELARKPDIGRIIGYNPLSLKASRFWKVWPYESPVQP